MLVADVDTITPDRVLPGAPLAFVQRPSRAAIAGLAAAVAGATTLLLSLFWLLTARSIVDPQALALAAEQPAVALQLAMALIVALSIAGFAMRRLVHLVGRRRDVVIEGGVATVVDSRFGRAQRWQQPVAAFCGLARAMPSSASGTRHAIVLVHPDASRHVVLTCGGRPDGDSLAQLMRQLDLPEVPDRLLTANARIEPTAEVLVEATSNRLAA